MDSLDSNGRQMSHGDSNQMPANAQFVPQDSTLKPRLDNIFAEVEKSLPSIDFELSDVSSEEGDVPIFHRLLKTPTEDEEDDYLLDDIPEAFPPREFCAPSSETESLDEGPPAPMTNTWVHEGFAEDNEKLKEVPELSPKRPEGKRPQRVRKGSGEKAKEEKLEGLKKDSEKLVSQYMPKSAGVLTLQSLDIDVLLQHADVPSEAGDGSFDLPASQPKDTTIDNISLIQKLAEFSVHESGTNLKDVDPTTGALHRRRPVATGSKQAKTDRNQSVAIEAVQRQKTKTTSCGTSTNDLENLPRVSPPPRPPGEKKETVYLDLRGFDKNKAEEQENLRTVQRILHLTGPQTDVISSDSDSEDEVPMSREQRLHIKESLRRTGSMPSDFGRPSSSAKSAKTKQPPPTERTQADRLAGHLPPQGHRPPPSDTTPQEPPTPEAEGLGSAEGDRRPLQPSEKEKQRRLEAARKLRERRDQERQSRLRLGQRLEVLRPPTSTRGRQCVGEETPTLFDVESSYEPAPEPLPPGVLTNTEMLLLTIHLSSNGEIMHKSGGGKSIDTGFGFSATYTTLLTWLLSLVPDDFTFLQGEPPSAPPPVCPAPFHVLGLQQLCVDGDLGLYVAVVPVETFTARDVPNRGRKKKDQVKDSTPFRQILSKYFSVNSLHTVCHWLQDLVSLEVSSANQSEPDQTGSSFAYKPPLPSIATRPLATYIQVRPDPEAVGKIFGARIGFFWNTLDSDEQCSEQNLTDDDIKYETQNTMSLVYKKVYRNPCSMMGILNRALQEGLDLAGIRLLYPTPDLMNAGRAQPPSDTEVLNNIGPILALAIRGTFARMLWLDAIGPSDPVLARRTDPNSLCALYGGETREECLLFCPRNPSRILSELCRWFGARVPPSGVIDVGGLPQKQRHSSDGKRSKKPSESDSEVLPSHRPPAALVATSTCDVFLAISPLVPVSCLGLLLAVAQRRGYQLRGVRRMKLHPKRASVLGLSGAQLHTYTDGEVSATVSPQHTYPVPAPEETVVRNMTGTPQRPATLLLLHKENAMHNSAALVEAFMVQMSLLGLLGDVQSEACVSLTSALLYHTAPYSDSLLGMLGGDFARVTDTELSPTPGYVSPRLHSNPEMEQIAVITLTGHHLMKTFGLFLGKLLGVVPHSRTQPLSPLPDGFELLGIKWLPSLSIHHAKELTPYEVGHRHWKASIHTLTSEPAVVLVLRGINAFKRLDSLIRVPQETGASLERILSATPELAYRQTTMFFLERELFADNVSRSMLPYLPPVRGGRTAVDDRRKAKPASKPDLPVEESIIQTMLSEARPLTTVLVAKPDVVARQLSKLLKRVGQEGFIIVGLRLEVLTGDRVNDLLPAEDGKNAVLRGLHVDYLTARPSLVLCLQRENAVKHLLDLLGPDDPKQAKRQNSFLWRAVFGNDPVVNGLYCSRDYASSVADQKIFFPEGLCCKNTQDLLAEQITCPAVLPRLDVKLNRSKKAQFTKVQNSLSASLSMSSPTELLSRGTGTSNHGNTGAYHMTSLTQTNCLILTPGLTAPQGRGKKRPYVEVLEHLLGQGFELSGAEMMWLTRGQSEQLLVLLDAGSFKLVPLLTAGPCIILAVQRDNAVMIFDSLLGSSFDKQSIYSRYSDQILRPKTTQQSASVLSFFFEALMPGAHTSIVESKDLLD